MFWSILESIKRALSNLVTWKKVWKGKKRSFNKEFSYGFRIQLYNGLEIEAKRTSAKFKLDFPETKTHLVYSQPEWKIQVGFYKTKLEADRALLNFKRKYQSEIVIPLGK